MRPRTRPSFRSRLQELLHTSQREPSLQRLGIWVDLVLVVSIIASCATVVAQLLVGHTEHPVLHQTLRVAEAVFTGLFTIEYLLRWYAAPNRWRYPFGVYAIVDLIAILPSLLMFAHVLGLGSELLAVRVVHTRRFLRLTRLMRLLRVLRGGYNAYRLLVTAKTWTSAVVGHYRLRRVAVIALVVALAWIAGANALFLFERLGFDPNNPSPYMDGASLWDAYWDAYWWVDIYLVSGFDAPTPVTWAARIAVTTLLLAGVLVTAAFEGEVVTFLVRSSERRGRLALMPPGLPLAEHVVILGRNNHLERIIVEVHRAFGGRHYVLVVCEDAETICSPGPPVHSRVFALSGNPARDDVLQAAKIDKALRVIILAGSDRNHVAPSDRDDATLMHALAVVARNPTVPIVVELLDPESLLYASSIQTADCIVNQHFGEMLIAQAVNNTGIAEVFDDLTTFTADANEFYRIRVPPHLVGKTFRDAQEYFLDLDSEAVLPVGVDAAGPRPFENFRLSIARRTADTTADSTDRVSLLRYVLSNSDRLIVCAFEHPSFDVGNPEDKWKNNENPPV